VTDRRATDQTTPTVAASGDRGVGVGGDVTNSNIFTGDIKFEAPVTTALLQLRAPVGDFVGRSQEINTLINALRHESRACITGISGMGGIGKTELALLVAERLRDDYPDAQFFINLQGTDANPRSPQEAMAICIRAFLGPEVKLPEEPEQLTNLYHSQLSGKRVLLLLDNAADSAQVRPLLPPTGCAVLVTSRQSVALPGMTPLTLYPLPEKEARQLLLEIAARAQPAAEQICELCGYLPLALRAAGSLLAITADLDPVDYAAQLQDERSRLDRIGTEGVEIDLAASFNLSYARLAPAAARVFRLLSVFPATFDAVAEEVVCADAGHVQLSELVRRSLVLYDESTKRYRLHDLARLFADTKLSAEERADGQKRFATHYRDVLAAAKKLYKEGGESLLRGLALFDLEWGNIQAGHAWVAAQADAADADVVRLGMTYPDAGVYVLHLRQHARERVRWLEIALAAARRLQDRDGEGVALGNLGVAYKNLGETRQAIHFHEQHLAIAREIGDHQGEGYGLGNLGNAYADLGEARRAIQFYEQALLIHREMGDRRGEGNALTNMGLAYEILGETRRAIEFYEQALLIDREIGDHTSEGTDLWNMSLALDLSASALKPSGTPNRHSPSTSRSKIPTPRRCARNLPTGASKQTLEIHFFTDRERKPISLRSRAGFAINCRIASKTTLNCLSYLLSSSSSRRESSALDESICRSFTNARRISILTNIARSLFSTLESIATPCSVKT
jgi:tetratricopeptide (TPR) repeat protein